MSPFLPFILRLARTDEEHWALVGWWLGGGLCIDSKCVRVTHPHEKKYIQQKDINCAITEAEVVAQSNTAQRPPLKGGTGEGLE